MDSRPLFGSSLSFSRLCICLLLFGRRISLKKKFGNRSSISKTQFSLSDADWFLHSCQVGATVEASKCCKCAPSNRCDSTWNPFPFEMCNYHRLRLELTTHRRWKATVATFGASNGVAIQFDINIFCALCFDKSAKFALITRGARVVGCVTCNLFSMNFLIHF